MIRRVALFGILVSIAGCGNETKDASTTNDESQKSTSHSSDAKPPIGGVAVVDLDDVLRQLKLKKPFEQEVVSFRDKSREELQKALAKFQSDYDAKKKEFGSEPTKEQTAELQKLFTEGHQAYSKRAAELEKQLAELQASFVRKVREKAMTVARKVAIKKGLTMVMTKDDVHHLWYSPDVDITSEVAEGLQDQRDSLKLR